MTIKHFNKNISAEPENVITDVTLNEGTGILTFTQKNFYTGNSTTFTRDLSGIKLRIVKLASQSALTSLENDNTQEDYKKTHLFLVPLSENNTEGIYAEYIYVEDSSTNVWSFERIGSTELDLSNYIQKSNGTNLLLTDGTNIAQSTFAQATALTSKENTSNKSSSITTDTGSTSKYPTVKAVEDYAEPKKPLGTLTDFKSLIENATANQIIILDRDYKGTENCSISLNKTVTIIGNGHTINANNYRLVINLGTSSTLTFIDCIFTNINVDETSYSFIKTIAANRSSLTLHNCIIKNSTVKNGGLIVGQDNGNYGVIFNITNCIFYNNTVNSSASGLLVFINNNFNVLNTVFENNTVTSIRIANNTSSVTNQQVIDCVFNNNVSAITESSSSEIYKKVVLKNNYFLQAGDTITGCVNNNYLTSHQDISGKEDTSNKVTTMSSSSTDTQYPSAKAVYDTLPKTTKTLTVTYTNGTTEDIEFYIK